jgi:hypothetical protein
MEFTRGLEQFRDWCVLLSYLVCSEMKRDDGLRFGGEAGPT